MLPLSPAFIIDWEIKNLIKTLTSRLRIRGSFIMRGPQYQKALTRVDSGIQRSFPISSLIIPSSRRAKTRPSSFFFLRNRAQFSATI